MRSLLLICSICFVATVNHAQNNIDSSKLMDNILIKAYNTNSVLQKVPASVSVISKSALQNVSTYSMLPSFNNLAGVRMEERSPGSYRLSIRGSLLRSPFGVRNVKIYWDEFMFTDAGGNSYLNLLDINGVNQVEVIKGPPGSICGAGTGGAVLFSGPTSYSKENRKGINLSLSTGSFGTFNESFNLQQQTKKYSATLTQGHYESNGYRIQSSFRKDNLQYEFQYKTSQSSSLNGFLLLSDLHYETPGGLTAAQFAADPKQARPATPTLPSAVDQRAGIYNKTGLLGLSSRFTLSERWKNITSITSSITRFKNPFITNFETRNETNIGFRSKFVYENKKLYSLLWTSGTEAQFGNYKIDSAGNLRGIRDGKSVVDMVKVSQLFAFTQIDLAPIEFIRLQFGVSLNTFKYDLERIKGSASNFNQPLNFNPQLLPRMAMIVEPHKNVGVYLQIARGYSSPTIAEIRPSAGGFYTGLQAEYGWNKEVGIKIQAFGTRFTWALDYFDFRLKDAIVRQINSAGAEYFVNAGSTLQKGVESELNLTLIQSSKKSFFQKVIISQSATFNDFVFKQYNIGSNNFSGKNLTGVPKQVFIFSIQSELIHRFYLNFNFNYTGIIPLNDANTVQASRYKLLQSKFGWKKRIKKADTEYFVLIDNLLNSTYSLGNDLNAFGLRFFNAAPPRNFLFGVKIGF
jgi:iron complex outermembrane receptor protein